MSGNPQLDQQIAAAIQPQFNPLQQMQQPTMPQQNFSWQRPAVQNPVFGGAVPMNFGLNAENQIPANFQPRQFQQGLSQFNPYVPDNSMSPLAQWQQMSIFGSDSPSAPVDSSGGWGSSQA